MAGFFVAPSVGGGRRLKSMLIANSQEVFIKQLVITQQALICNKMRPKYLQVKGCRISLENKKVTKEGEEG